VVEPVQLLAQAVQAELAEKMLGRLVDRSLVVMEQMVVATTDRMVAKITVALTVEAMVVKEIVMVTDLGPAAAVVVVTTVEVVGLVHNQVMQAAAAAAAVLHILTAVSHPNRH
jgi:hypothetical protein